MSFRGGEDAGCFHVWSRWTDLGGRRLRQPRPFPCVLLLLVVLESRPGTHRRALRSLAWVRRSWRDRVRRAGPDVRAFAFSVGEALLRSESRMGHVRRG